LEGIVHLLILGTLPARPELLWKTMVTVVMFVLDAKFWTMTLECKWEVSVLVSSSYVRLGTAC